MCCQLWWQISHVTKSSHHYSWMILWRCHQVDCFNTLSVFWVIHVKRFRKLSTHEPALCLQIIDLRHMSLSHGNMWKDCGSLGKCFSPNVKVHAQSQIAQKDVLSHLRRLKWPLNFHIKGVVRDLHWHFWWEFILKSLNDDCRLFFFNSRGSCEVTWLFLSRQESEKQN